jgi:hypothetical protein
VTTSRDLVLRVGGADVDDFELTEMAAGLRRDLLALDVDDVRPLADGRLPEGAKSGTAITLGALVVSTSPAVVGGVIAIVSSWLSRQPKHIEVEIEGQKLSGAVTAAQRDAIVQAYLAKAGRTEREPEDQG